MVGGVEESWRVIRDTAIRVLTNSLLSLSNVFILTLWSQIIASLSSRTADHGMADLAH